MCSIEKISNLRLSSWFQGSKVSQRVALNRRGGKLKPPFDVSETQCINDCDTSSSVYTCVVRISKVWWRARLTCVICLTRATKSRFLKSKAWHNSTVSRAIPSLPFTVLYSLSLPAARLYALSTLYLAVANRLRSASYAVVQNDNVNYWRTRTVSCTTPQKRRLVCSQQHASSLK